KQNALPAPSFEHSFRSTRVINLTQPHAPETPNYCNPSNFPLMCGFGGIPGVEPYRRNAADVTDPKGVFIYVENIKSAEWGQMSGMLFSLPVEFVDSAHLGVCRRQRGYLHNLPINDRWLPDWVLNRPKTIFEAFPNSRQAWPSWDKRTKLNVINTQAFGVASKLQQWNVELQIHGAEGLSPQRRQELLTYVRKFNLLWIERDRLAPLEVDQLEDLMGYPERHVSTVTANKTSRYKML
ncbi:unnamed protein product, partial [Closterium sp. NIES-54]